MAKLTLNFLSHKLRRAVDVTVVLPSMNFTEMQGEAPSHRLKAKFPVIYLLHGYGNNHAIWNAYTNVEMFAEERYIAVVMISGENKSYVNVETGSKAFDMQERYYEFLSEEIPEFVTEYFPISREPSESYIAGLSMGGFGAMLHGLRDSRMYRAIGAFSGGGFSRGKARIPGRDTDRYDIRAQAEKCAAEDRKIPIYMACGDLDDGFGNLKETCAAMKDMGFDITWVEGKDYRHEWRFWNREIEAFMDWMPRNDAWYLGKGNRRNV